MTLAAGTTAPDFTLKDTDGNDVTLSGFRGEQNVVLVFYPFTFTGVCQGELCALDGRTIAWSYSTKSGADGTVTIDGQSFDLKKGGVLLVWTNDKKTRVEQLAVEMSKLKDGPIGEKLESLGNAEPRIAAFFKEPRAEE